MKIQNNKTKLLIEIASITSLMFSVTSPVFATNVIDFGPWNVTSSTSSWCSNTQTCASANTSGDNQIISYAMFPLDDEVASAFNNQDPNAGNVGTSPSLSTTVSSVYFETGITYIGNLSPQSGATTGYWAVMDIYQNNGSNLYATCSSPGITGSGVVSNTMAISCSESNSGANTYYEGSVHNTEATNPGSVFGTSKADFWNSPNHAQTNYLEICDSC